MTINDPIPNNDAPPSSEAAPATATGHEVPDVSTGAPTATSADGPVPPAPP